MDFYHRPRKPFKRITFFMIILNALAAILVAYYLLKAMRVILG